MHRIGARAAGCSARRERRACPILLAYGAAEMRLKIGYAYRTSCQENSHVRAVGYWCAGLSGRYIRATATVI